MILANGQTITRGISGAIAIELANTLDVHGDVLDDPGWPVRLGDRQPGGPGPARRASRRATVGGWSTLRDAVRDLLGARWPTVGHPSSAGARRGQRRRGAGPRASPADWPAGRRPAPLDGAQRDDRRRRAVSGCPLDHRTARRRGRRAAAALPRRPAARAFRGARRPARWCDSRTCGNRVRVARHAARRRAR